MAFIIQARTLKPGEDHVTEQAATPQDAHEIAMGLIGRGMTDILILTETRVYRSSELADFVRSHLRRGA